MLELGEDSKKAHEGMGRLLADSKADMVFLYGKETAAGLKALKPGRFFHSCDINEMKAAVNEYVRDGDLVLLKGSRGCALERVFGGGV
jgi:UDP-N-acetylmuramoyl-tripeptide--D-alanyl-D-alanine ligase